MRLASQPAEILPGKNSLYDCYLDRPMVALPKVVDLLHARSWTNESDNKVLYLLHASCHFHLSSISK